MQKIVLCKKHKRYKAESQPKNACPRCWEVWLRRKFGIFVSSDRE
jgi:hypothetical protein